MKLHINGAAQSVTGSQFLVEVDGRRLLLDCGLVQGSAHAPERNQTFSFDPLSLDAVILSHAHIDHSGNLPNLVKQGYVGPIYTTPVTAQLANIMLRDSAHIQQADADYMNQRNRKKNKPLVWPLYTLEDAVTTIGLFRSQPYDLAFEPIPRVTARLVEAGHILGSAAIVLDVNQPGSSNIRFWYSGDIGRWNLPLVRDPVLPEGVNTLLMECTYGDSPHLDIEDAFEKFQQVVGRTIKRGGKVIIPAFAVGRTQELVHAMEMLIEAGELPPVPVFVDSPLAVEASKVFLSNPDYFDEETQEFVEDTNDPALRFEQLAYISSVDGSKALNERKGPMVIISASGMAENGRILHHLKNNIEDERNTVLIVSFQAPGTLGRRLAEGQKRVEIFGDSLKVRAEVVRIDGLSAHAGQEMLIDYALATKDTLQRVILVHGEADAAEDLTERLLDAGIPEVDYPELGEVIEI